ncbi:protein of unknown function [Taphrina deformans PYCC 5710]|uniref:Enoyl-CoA hydratase/isomerase family protein n=1 Tax=Taphrina deformans (strain PYCC 5710 / ATCC 11124 / CBS 356.35 / IMI 108563 / JCM 9778 / NBRC 8474) TaxID=1097556 RepID=R4XGT0_TAPDE|nr:protein of unknown function [Taphrina deformans PYCC 5710]|eukprot:CCG85001.1 protein of unknown function [Taphrina deformans PYCC 5710]
MSLPSFQTLKLSLTTDGVLTITFSTPGGNAMSPELFKEWREAIRYAQETDAVKVMVQTGSGRYYSSGKDLRPTMHDSFETEMNEEMDILEDLINALINFQKPSIAAVNGPAIGLSVTSLALFDFVYAVSSATFTVPFMRWGFCAEGCSSLLFPRLLGRHTANELLLAGSTLSASALKAVGFLEVLDGGEFIHEVNKKASILASYDPTTVRVTKSLVNERYRQELMTVNHTELSTLKVMMMKHNSRKAIQDFVDERAAKQQRKKSKL